MSAPMGIKDAIWQKAQSLATNIADLSNSLPKDEIYELKMRLMHSVASLPEYLVKGFDNNKRIDKIRSFIYASSQLEECKGYLNLIEKMKYSDVSELRKQVDEMSIMLKINSGTFN